jgi:hypothetical protein
MANKFTRFLGQFGGGLLGGATNPKGGMGNWQHASRVFIDNTFRLSPRTKFLFYVQFEIDPTVHKGLKFTNNHTRELGVLVKRTDLPKFNFDSDVKHQYNRKKIVYKMINYDPVNINLHDDSAGVVNALWAIYYGYYIADRNNPNSAYETNHYRPANTAKDNFRYGMDNNISAPFFKSVSIYTMSRRRFQGYTLVNPRIKSWQHGDVDYALSNETVESTMQLEYEAVTYSAGEVTYNNPKGFAELHYDTTPSPLSVAGGGVANLLGSGGVLDGLESIFGDISSGAAFESPGSFLGTAIQSINTYKNLRGLSKESIKQEAVNILSNPAAIATAVSTVGGVVGTVFPKSNTTTEPVDATQRNITPPTITASGGTLV